MLGLKLFTLITFFLAFLKLLLFSLLCWQFWKKVSKLSWYWGLYISMCSTHISENPYGGKKKKRLHTSVLPPNCPHSLLFSHTLTSPYTHTHTYACQGHWDSLAGLGAQSELSFPLSCITTIHMHTDTLREWIVMRAEPAHREYRGRQLALSELTAGPHSALKQSETCSTGQTKQSSLLPGINISCDYNTAMEKWEMFLQQWLLHPKEQWQQENHWWEKRRFAPRRLNRYINYLAHRQPADILEA